MKFVMYNRINLLYLICNFITANFCCYQIAINNFKCFNWIINLLKLNITFSEHEHDNAFFINFGHRKVFICEFIHFNFFFFWAENKMLTNVKLNYFVFFCFESSFFNISTKLVCCWQKSVTHFFPLCNLLFFTQQIILN